VIRNIQSIFFNGGTYAMIEASSSIYEKAINNHAVISVCAQICASQSDEFRAMLLKYHRHEFKTINFALYSNQEGLIAGLESLQAGCILFIGHLYQVGYIWDSTVSAAVRTMITRDQYRSRLGEHYVLLMRLRK
ncbi:hypothetical protein PFISCL1PPCAC_11098, partial [Pristionchus fissidentatus]